MQPNSFHQILKEETKPYHDQLEMEELPKKLFNLSISRDEYIEYLLIFKALHSVIERKLLDFNEWSELEFDIKKYFREELIDKDLAILDVKYQNSFLIDLDIKNFSYAIGYLYVLTGSTMGGMILSKKVVELFDNKSSTIPNNYFSAFGEATHPMFFQFLGFVNNYIQTSDDLQKQDIIEGAKECYLLVHQGFINGFK